MLGASALSAHSRFADTATSKKGAFQPMPCPGTYGQVKENSTGQSEGWDLTVSALLLRNDSLRIEVAWALAHWRVESTAGARRRGRDRC